MTTNPSDRAARHRRSRIALLAGAVGLALTASACGGGTGDGGDLTAPGADALKDHDGVVEVEFWHSMDATNGEVLEELIDEFNKENKGKIKVKSSFQGIYDDTLAKYRGAVQKGDTPELVQIYDIGTRFMIDAKQAIPAQSFVDKDDFDASKLEEGLRNYYTVEGELQSFPFNSSTPLLYINKDAFEAAGLDPEKPPKTLEEVKEYSEKLTEKDGSKVEQYGLGAAMYGWFIEQFKARAGESYCNKGNGREGPATEVTYDKGTGVEVVEWWKDMLDEGYAVNVGRKTEDSQAAFNSGRAAMTLDSTSALGAILEQADFEVGTGYFPLANDDDPGGSIIGGASLWINGPGHEQAEQRASWEFVKFLLSPEAQSKWHAGTGYLSVNTDGYEQPEAKEQTEKFPQSTTALDQLRETKPDEATAGCLLGVMSEGRIANEEGWERAVTGEGADPQEELTKSAEKMQGSIAKYNESIDD